MLMLKCYNLLGLGSGGTLFTAARAHTAPPLKYRRVSVSRAIWLDPEVFERVEIILFYKIYIIIIMNNNNILHLYYVLPGAKRHDLGTGPTHWLLNLNQAAIFVSTESTLLGEKIFFIY
jgi:hypothetical protein